MAQAPRLFDAGIVLALRNRKEVLVSSYLSCHVGYGRLPCSLLTRGKRWEALLRVVEHCFSAVVVGIWVHKLATADFADNGCLSSRNACRLVKAGPELPPTVAGVPVRVALLSRILSVLRANWCAVPPCHEVVLTIL